MRNLDIVKPPPFLKMLATSEKKEYCALGRSNHTTYKHFGYVFKIKLL